MAPAPVTEKVVVPLDAAAAHELFTAGLGTWWPPEYSWSQTVLEEMAIEGREGGFCYECGPHGFRLDWGRVVEWDPPSRLRFTWQIEADRTPQPDPDRCSEVTVTFGDDQNGTAVEVSHDGWERHGDKGASYREALASSKGWPYLLECFQGKAKQKD